MALVRPALTAASLGALAILAGTFAYRPRMLPQPHLVVKPARILADGYDTAIVSIPSRGGPEPRVSVIGNGHIATLESLRRSGAQWEARLRAGVLPGRVRIRVELAGAPAAGTELETSLATGDTAADGTPDFLRLDDERDRQAFRRWFTWLAEAQSFQRPGSRPAEIQDCAALIRYAYREALHVHDGAWAATAGLPLAPPFDSVVKYQYPFTPLGAALFRVRPGAFQPADLTNGTFAQFADVRTLWRLNTHRLSRTLAAALPGDLLFFRQAAGAERFHSMIYLGASLVQNDGRRYILYHTGPTGADPGEIRRPAVEELIRFPRPEWRPLASNPSFLGVFRWNILWEGR